MVTDSFHLTFFRITSCSDGIVGIKSMIVMACQIISDLTIAIVADSSQFIACLDSIRDSIVVLLLISAN